MPRDSFPDVAEEFEVKEPLMLIHIGTYLHLRNDPYDAVRWAWKVNRGRLDGYNLVLAQANGLVVGAYRPTEWLPATRENFPGRVEEDFTNPVTGSPTRWGFVGEHAKPEDWNYYVGTRVPERYRCRAPVRYCDPDTALCR